MALAQTRYAAALLERTAGVQVEVVPVVTEGDRRSEPLPDIGGKGLFTAALEERLASGEIDAAVHSLKDLPTELPPGLQVLAVLARDDPRDALVSPTGGPLSALPRGARVGTSSPRREALLRHERPDLTVVPLRGNLDTRLARLGVVCDALVVAEAGLRRLGRSDVPRSLLPAERFVPAPGQGAIAVEVRDDLEPELLRLLAALDDAPTHRATSAERRFLAALGGGCSAPVGAYAQAVGDELELVAFRAGPDGRGGRFGRARGRDEVAERLAGEFLRDGDV